MVPLDLHVFSSKPDPWYKGTTEHTEVMSQDDIGVSENMDDAVFKYLSATEMSPDLRVGIHIFKNSIFFSLIFCHEIA